jgi:hypothetical protein
VKTFTIVRRRVVTQVSTHQYEANTEEEAVTMAMLDQKQAVNEDDCNEWIDDGDTTYLPLDKDDILEVT